LPHSVELDFNKIAIPDCSIAVLYRLLLGSLNISAIRKVE